jgi:hypothetical protein
MARLVGLAEVELTIWGIVVVCIAIAVFLMARGERAPQIEDRDDGL